MGDDVKGYVTKEDIDKVLAKMEEVHKGIGQLTTDVAVLNSQLTTVCKEQDLIRTEKNTLEDRVGKVESEQAGQKTFFGLLSGFIGAVVAAFVSLVMK